MIFLEFIRCVFIRQQKFAYENFYDLVQIVFGVSTWFDGTEF